jgi:hypothetical protein
MLESRVRSVAAPRPLPSRVVNRRPGRVTGRRRDPGRSRPTHALIYWDSSPSVSASERLIRLFVERDLAAARSAPTWASRPATRTRGTKAVRPVKSTARLGQPVTKPGGAGQRRDRVA